MVQMLEEKIQLQVIFCATCLATFKSVALQLHEQGCYTASNSQTCEGGGLRRGKYWSWLADRAKHCETSCWRGVTLRNGDWKLLQSLQKVELSYTSCNIARSKNVARQVAEVTCYTVQFFSNLCRSGVARQVSEKIAQWTPPWEFSFMLGFELLSANV